VLEAAEHARARGATAHGEIAGFAASAGAGQLASEEDPARVADRLARVIDTVLEESEETPDLVSLHGDSVPAHDAAEQAALARAGATVVINSREQHERAKETLGAIEAAGGHAFVHQADVSVRRQAGELIEAVVARAGRLDILVNNAGISREGLFLEMSDDEW